MMKKWAVALLASAMSVGMSAQTDDVTTIFIYSPGERDGLHLAVREGETWREVGQLCASDYGQWGAEKRMYHPSVCRASDGTWRLVFQLNDRTPAFAAAYSPDLITWRPQDYPRMSTRQCLEPVVFEAADGSFDVYFKTAGGDKRFVSATQDFRHFGPDEPSQIDRDAWLRDTATVNGQLREGNQFDIPVAEASRIVDFHRQQAEDGRLSAERMHDDGERFASMKSPISATLTVDMSRQKPISDKLIGVFFEDISYAADGGLYAEMGQNRDFEYTPRDHQGWNAQTAWHSNGPLRVVAVDPLSANNPHYVVVTTDSLVNEGWDGMAVQAGQKYDFSFFAKNLGEGRKQFDVVLLSADNHIVAKARLKTDATSWQHYATTLTARATDAHCRLAIVPKGRGEVALDLISLFPQETFMGRKNGLRKDLAQAIADLKPKFVRFPGGCMSHGQGLQNIYHWNETVGPLQDRKPDMNIWHYHQTRGLGFFEYFQFCEDIGAEPLPVLAAGVPCQNSANDRDGWGGQQGGIPMADMPAYIQELLDLIDWANGDPATSRWAKMRADAGHPAPFNLKYIGIGNEDIISTVFEERYEMIAKAIRQRYPDIKICGTVGPFHTPSADYLEGWDFTRRHADLQYMVDEHYYESTGWFLHHRDYYDHYDRNGVKVYLGEWAASTKAKRPNVETALAEALYLTDIERNGDVVEMTSYAPMLCKDGHSNWNPDMIYFSNTDVRTTPAYDVQRLFSVYSGNQYVNSELRITNYESQASDSHPSELTIQNSIAPRLGASVVRDSKTGKTYLKLVNALPVELRLSVNGLDIPATARYEGFNGQPEEQQLNIVTDEIGENITLPPYSFRVIEL